VKLTRDATARWSGTVEEVLERGVTAFLGTVEIQGRNAWVNAADRRLQLRCAVAPADLQGARGGEWVIAKVTRHAGAASPAQGVVLKRLDPDRPVELATESAIARFDLPCEFPAAALREAQAFGAQVDPRATAGRVDVPELALLSIYGDDERDFDDAVLEPHLRGLPADRRDRRREPLRASRQCGRRRRRSARPCISRPACCRIRASGSPVFAGAAGRPLCFAATCS
jgi:ribonuclease R